MPTKYRVKTVPGGLDTVTFTCHSADPLPDPPISYPPYTRDLLYSDYVELKESTWDESWNGDRKTWKNFEHYKLSSKKPRARPQSFVNSASFAEFHMDAESTKQTARWKLFTAAGSYTTPFGEAGEPNALLPAFYQLNAIDGTFVPQPSQLEYLNSKALSVMLPKIKEDLSLVNSIIELKDFRSLPGLISRFRQIVPFVMRFVKSRKSIPSLLDFLKLPAETFLTYQFAMAPLVRDIMGLYASLADYQAQINDLINRQGKMQQRHFTYRWNEFPESVSELSPSYGLDQSSAKIDDPAYTWIQYRDTDTDASEFHAEIQYNYNYTKFQETHAASLRLLDRLGLNLNGQILWNALPWTFVIDWVVDVNRFLGTYAKVQNMEPMVNILQYLWSIKRRRTIRTGLAVNTVSPLVPNHYVAGQRIPYPVVTETAYRRQVGLPGASSITLSGLNLKEFSLGAALAICQRRYRGTRRLSAPRT
jgi:hypothetical protein